MGTSGGGSFDRPEFVSRFGISLLPEFVRISSTFEDKQRQNEVDLSEHLSRVAELFALRE